MPLLVYDLLNEPASGVYRALGPNDEAVISPAYVTGVRAALKPAFESIYWQNEFRFADARKRLAQTQYLSPGWDSYGGEPPYAVARGLATTILELLERNSLSPTRLTPSAEGGIAFSFVEGGSRAVIEIYNTGEIAAAYSDEGEPAVWEVEATEPAELRSIEQIRADLTN